MELTESQPQKPNRVILIAGGASVCEGIDLGLWEKIKNEQVWLMNYEFLFCPYLVDRLCWVDTNFFKKHTRELEALSKTKTQLFTKPHPKYKYIPEIQQLEVTRSTQEADTKGMLFVGQSGLVGMFSLSLALKEGFKEVYILGMDFGAKSFYNQKTHWYQGQKSNPELLKLLNLDFLPCVDSGGFSNNQIYMHPSGTPKPKISELDYFLNRRTKFYSVGFTNTYQFEKITYPEFFAKLT